ncbi:MAG TPA: DNA alkylation repair protein [Candidatus Binatia bacterium]|nr:DNA alkylation repair protein [Candidatus Binatia bacterium]
MTTLAQAKKELNRHADPVKAEFLKRFFKTGKGEYAAGDIFIGVVVPKTRLVARQFISLPIREIFQLLKSKIHEERLLALIILDLKFSKSSDAERKLIVTNYLKLAGKYVNNWDLVDTSAPYILGAYLFNKPRGILYKLAKSKNLWEKRISIISTQYFIRKNDFTDTMKISEILLNDTHDLIHKAVGWMLREVGNRSIKTETAFLNKYAHKMPRTMLRYAIEKFPEKDRIKYLKKKQ